MGSENQPWLLCEVIPPVRSRYRAQRSRAVEEETDRSWDMIEATLAHVLRNRIELIYACSDLFERWRVMMDDWEHYLAQMDWEGPGPIGQGGLRILTRINRRMLILRRPAPRGALYQRPTTKFDASPVRER